MIIVAFNAATVLAQMVINGINNGVRGHGCLLLKSMRVKWILCLIIQYEYRPFFDAAAIRWRSQVDFNKCRTNHPHDDRLHL